MRRVFGQLIGAVVLFAVGYISWTAGRLQRRMADAHEQLAVLRYNAADAEYGDIESSMAYLRRVPYASDALLADVRDERATGAYWQARYELLNAPRDANSTGDQEPT